MSIGDGKFDKNAPSSEYFKENSVLRTMLRRPKKRRRRRRTPDLRVWGRSEAPSGVRVVAPRAHAFSCNLEARSAVREDLELLWLIVVEKSYWKAWRRILGCFYHVANRE